ncbi:DUF4147 domain-containing protein [Thiorhodococcus mannitoliphagus]|uniref:DUF4147 domain-containing protein n=1 Tax=Thiorhodococcus mannitoliphagus TaxID=329406 RepID=A0A6P1DVX5_9GAMM|nr:DUF4147 domain-containing protein [Thiorhodococcus mannitoliphagus]NEX21161.1 DUF4147 domain-containing protein [Thiorhodococcus mannitoliphagus]
MTPRSTSASQDAVSGARELMLELLMAGLKAVNGRLAVRSALANTPMQQPVWVCAIGKAAEAMVLGASDVIGDRLDAGLVVTKLGHAEVPALEGRGIRVRIGGHPVPNNGSLEAGQDLLTTLRTLPADAKLLFLISGGASSLVEAPVQGIGLPELQRVNTWLLGSGLPISAMNLVRKSLSLIKGGGLLRQLEGRSLRALAISDVPGDLPEVIGSGLLTPEPDLAQRVGQLDLPDWLAAWVDRGIRERGSCQPEMIAVEIVANLSQAKLAIAAAARHRGLPVRLHEDRFKGDAATLGRDLAKALLASERGLHIWGGEPTVQLPSSPGRGGRNQHLALAAAIELAGHAGHFLLSAGSDGTDGPTEDAGALVDADTLDRAEMTGLSAQAALSRADAGTLLEASGDLVRTGPTGTNVMDIVLGLKT